MLASNHSTRHIIHEQRYGHVNLLMFLLYVAICLIIGFGAKLLDAVESRQGEANDSWRRVHESIRDAR
jgi:hypothetical protein